MAQLVEQRIRNAWVTGSSPVFGSTFHSDVKALRLLRCEDVKMFIDSTHDSSQVKTLRKTLNTLTPSHLHILTP